MEYIRGKCKATPEDAISILPEGVITNILDCLPIQDAVGTSILSRKWRYKWTALTQLVFDDNFVEQFRRGSDFIQYGRIISRLLLHIRGNIRKFVLYMPYCYYSRMDFEDINNWIMLLSTKGIRELTLINMHAEPFELSTHLLSCTDLKHLTLQNCYLRHMTIFCGFPNLLELEFNRVRFKDSKIGELITSCTFLEVLKLNTAKRTGNIVKLFEIAKLQNLKLLSLTLYGLDNLAFTASDIFQLMASLRKLQTLALDFENFKFMEENTAGKRALSALPSLKSLSLWNLNLSSRSMVIFAFDLIQFSPNLQTLKIMAEYQYPPWLVPLTSLEVESFIMGNLKRLQIVEYGSIIDSEIELCLIKSLLANCSLLKKMVIYCDKSRHRSSYLLHLADKLLAFPRASPIATMNLKDDCDRPKAT
uniref:F-box/FBD/LRR-repeat protein At1g13570-like n=1 Tax=Erigeron canadensis TaxID=72917 RepID=UPI001CB981EC|nr:F-box/FBD/LRR-repeat protein At1g13570-like [Erigeron canadensis]